MKNIRVILVTTIVLLVKWGAAHSDCLSHITPEKIGLNVFFGGENRL